MKCHYPALAMLVAAVPALAGETVSAPDPQLAALEARIAQLEGEHAKMPATDGLASKLKIDGFLSAGFGIMEDDDFAYDGIAETGSFDADGVMGLQVEGRVNDTTRGVVQLVGRSSEDDFDITAEWAYVGLKLTDSGELRVGQQRFPFFLMSEYIDVGYAYPWAKPPVEVYLPGMPSSYNGVSWHQDIEAGDFAHTLMGYWGSDRFSSAGGTFTLENSVGLMWTGSTGNWQFGASLSRGESTFSGGLFDALAAAGVVAPLDDALGEYGGLSIQYDNGRFLLMAEATEIRVEGYFADTAQEYVTVGYRVGKVLPTITYGSSRVTDADERPDNPLLPLMCAGPGTLCLDAAGAIPLPADTLSRLLDSPQDSVTLGARVDFARNAALKVDWTHVLDTHGTFGNFTRNDGNLFYGALPGDDLDAFRVVVDVVF
jgi:predicted porin